MAAPAEATHRIPDAALAAFTMVIVVAMVTNPVSLEFLGDVFLPALHAIAAAWSAITPW